MRPHVALLPLVPLYAAALAAKNLAYNRAWITPKHLRWQVVSIGNLSVGGAGKTPVVIRLAQLLRNADYSVDVLTRGYGRNSNDVMRVDPEGSAAEFGDEPLLIARAAGVPVYVGADRYAAGLLAESAQNTPGIHLLDDGFQHRRLGRELDIVVLHRSDFDEHLLPAGRLREPLSALKRASIIILRAEDRDLETELRRRNVDAPIWIQLRRFVIEPTPRAIAFCGIARPDEFFASLRANGIDLADTCSFRDHHAYIDSELDSLLQLRARHDADSLVTTEKDFVRLTPAQRDRLAPLHTARLEVVFENETAITGHLAGFIVRK
jgi:tetraacyldisaccharide 4'-kinase